MSQNTSRAVTRSILALFLLMAGTGSGAAETFFRTGVEFWQTGGKNQLIWWTEHDEVTNVYQFKYRFSHNSGKSWTDTALMWETDGSIAISEIDDFIIRKGGKLLIPIAMSEDATKCYSIRFLTSGNYGETWTLRDPIFQQCGSSVTITHSFCPRMDVRYTPPDEFRIVANLRMTPDTAKSFLITSTDGKKWKSMEIDAVPLDCSN